MTQYVNTEKYEVHEILEVWPHNNALYPEATCSTIEVGLFSIQVSKEFLAYYQPANGDFYMVAENGEDIVIPPEVFETDYKEVE